MFQTKIRFENFGKKSPPLLCWRVDWWKWYQKLEIWVLNSATLDNIKFKLLFKLDKNSVDSIGNVHDSLHIMWSLLHLMWCRHAVYDFYFLFGSYVNLVGICPLSLVEADFWESSMLLELAFRCHLPVNSVRTNTLYSLKNKNKNSIHNGFN